MVLLKSVLKVPEAQFVADLLTDPGLVFLPLHLFRHLDDVADKDLADTTEKLCKVVRDTHPTNAVNQFLDSSNVQIRSTEELVSVQLLVIHAVDEELPLFVDREVKRHFIWVDVK